MTTQFHSHKKHKRGGIAYLIFVILVALFLLVMSRILIPGMYASVVGGVLQIVNNTQLSGNDSSQNTLEVENDRLKRKLLDYSVLEEENKELKRLLALVDESSRNLGAHRILFSPPETPFDTLVIEGDAASEGADVFAEADIFIGLVREVSAETSFVLLVSGGGVTTPVVVDGMHRAEAVGKGGGLIEVKVPRTLDVREGALIAHRRNGSVIALVEEVKDSDEGDFKLLRARIPVSLNKLQYVFVEE